MNELELDLKAALADLLAESRWDRDPHPTPEQLVAYRAGELPAREEERVRDHVVACAHCLELLLDLERLSDPGFGAERTIPATEQAAAWRLLWTRLDPRPARGRLARLLASPRPAYALAAGLLVAALGLSAWALGLRRTVADLSRPQPNAPIVDLFAAGAVRGEGGATAGVELATGDRFFTVVLNPTGALDHSRYEVEIDGPRGWTAWADGGLVKNAHGSFTLLLARRDLPPGEYTVRLFGRAGERRELIEAFPLRIARR